MSIDRSFFSPEVDNPKWKISLIFLLTLQLGNLCPVIYRLKMTITYTWVTQMFRTEMFQKKGKIGTFAYKIRKCSNFFRKIFLENLRLKKFFVVITFPFFQESEFKISFEVLTQLRKANQQESAGRGTSRRIPVEFLREIFRTST